MLKNGDIVQYHRRSNSLDSLGFILHETYIVHKSKDSLVIYPVINDENNSIVLWNSKKEFTDAANHFKEYKHSKLSKGYNQ